MLLSSPANKLANGEWVLRANIPREGGGCCVMLGFPEGVITVLEQNPEAHPGMLEAVTSNLNT